MTRAAEQPEPAVPDADEIMALCATVALRIADARASIVIVSPPVAGIVLIAFGRRAPDGGAVTHIRLPIDPDISRAAAIGYIACLPQLNMMAHRCPVCFARDAVSLWPALADELASLAQLEHVGAPGAGDGETLH